jgi:type I restriction enzyme S subunit
MELMTKQGYKQTEVGLIPEDWKEESIGTITTKIVGGGTPSRSNSSYWNGNIPWVTVKDFSKFNRLSSQENITKLGLIHSASNLIPKGTLITSTRMALGKAFIYDVDVSINQDLKALFLKNNCDVLLLYYWFQINSKRIEEIGSGSTVMGISLTDLRKFIIPLPPTLTEQKAIATALSDVDALIASLEQTITKKKAIKQGAMQQLLTGKTRMKGFEGNGKFKQTEVGLIPEDWEVEPIGDLASISTGGSDTQDRVDDGAYPFFVRSQTIERINKYSFDGEAILTSGDGVGVGKIFHYVNCKFDYHQRVYNIHNYRNDVAGKYLFFQFSTHFYDRVMAMTAKSSVDSVRREMIADMQIPLPSTLTEQQAIAQILSDMDAEITHLETQKAKYQAIKQGMMQELLTGKTRLV